MAEPTTVKLVFTAAPAAKCLAELWGLFEELAASGKVGVFTLNDLSELSDLIRIDPDREAAVGADRQAFRLEPTDKLRHLVEAFRAAHRKDDVADSSHSGPPGE